MFDKGMLELSNYEDCVEYLESVGCGKFDVEKIENTMVEHFTKCSRGSAVEGLLGDDLWELERSLHDGVDELREVADLLRGPSRKDTTKAKMADKIDEILSNLDTVIDYCVVYDKSEL